VSGQNDLAKSLKAIMAARREDAGASPTPEELLAYRDGKLEPEERRRLEERIALYPDAARVLADLAAFPDVEAAAGTPELSQADVEARWQAFRRRLPDLPAAPGATEREGVRASGPGAAPLSRGSRPGLRLAAAAILGLVAGWVAGSRELAVHGRSGSAINVSIAELTPAGGEGLRSAPSPVEIPEGSEELVLVLGAPAREPVGIRGYAAELVDAGGRRIWSRQGLRPTALGTFRLAFRRGALDPGVYQVRLLGRDGRKRVLLATYDLRLLAPGPAR
jgi:anti-sigma factor RsiW